MEAPTLRGGEHEGQGLIAAVVAGSLAVPVAASAHPLESNLGVFSGQFPEINMVEAEGGRDFFRDSVEAEYDKTDNIGFVGFSARPAAGNLSLANSDIAFQGKRAYQGTFPGFRIIDISNASKPEEIINYENCRHPSGQGDIVVISRTRLLRPSRRPLESPRRIAARMPSRWRRRVRAALTNGASLERAAHPSQASRWAGASAGSSSVEQAQLVVEQEGAVEPLIADVDLPERAELIEALAVGCLQQRPARVLDPAAGRGVRAVVGVPFVAADLVDGVGGDADDVERVEADLGAGVLSDRLLIAA